MVRKTGDVSPRFLKRHTCRAQLMGFLNSTTAEGVRSMEAGRILEVVKQLDRQGRLRLYIALALQLTIRGREAYAYQRETGGETAKGLNELLHSVIGQALAVQSDSPTTSDEEVFARLFGFAEKLGVRAHLSLALDALPWEVLFTKGAPNN